MLELKADNIPAADAIIAMNDDEIDAAFKMLRWPETKGTPVCPRCNCQKIYRGFGWEYKCSACLHNFTTTSGTSFASRKMPLRSYLLAMALFTRGANALEVSQQMKLQYATAYRLAGILNDIGIKTQVGRRRKPVYLKCENCLIEFLDKNGEKTSSLRRGKHKYAFCSHECYGTFASESRANERCNRCRKTRRELSPFKTRGATGVSFNHGYCQKCYGLLKAYNWDEALCQVHEVTQQLKKESTNDIQCKKHSRPSESSTRGNRRGTQGKSGSPAGSGHQCSFFSHLAVGKAGLRRDEVEPR